MPLPEPVIITRKILANFFASNLHNTLIDEKNGSYTLSSFISPFSTLDQKAAYVLWNFPVKESLLEKWSRYPIYFAFNIKLKPNDDISSLNIKLFKEDTKIPTDSNIKSTELLLRVEWSNETSSNAISTAHAQPHWHIHSYTIVDKLEGIKPQERQTILDLIAEEESPANKFSIMDDINEIEVLDNEIEVDIQNFQVQRQKEFPSFKFHLAMLAEWEKPSTSAHNKKLTNSSLQFWLPQCLLYIKEQIEYVLERME